MKWLLILVPGLSLGAFLVALGWWTPGGNGVAMEVSEVSAVREKPLPAPTASASPPPASDERLQGAKGRLQGTLKRWQQRLRGHQQNPGNLRRFFRRLEGQCDTPSECEELLEAILEGYGDAAFAERVRAIMDQWWDYQARQDSTVLSREAPLAQRLESIMNLRANAFGTESAGMLFGREHARIRYRSRYHTFLKEQAPHMTPRQRLEAAEELRRETLAKHYETLSKAETDRERYKRELELRLVGVDNERERRSIAIKVGEKHFDTDKAQAIAERMKEEREQRARVREYNRRVEELEAEMAERRETDPDWEAIYRQRLRKIRSETFGAD